MLNPDYRDMLRALADENVKYVLVGAYAMAAHGYPRATMDIDIWVMPSPSNALAVMRAIERFGAPLQGLILDDLQKSDTIFQIGVAPRRIDILTGVSGLQFEEASARSVELYIDGITIPTLSLADLIRNKMASGRSRDIADCEALETLLRTEAPDPPDS